MELAEEEDGSLSELLSVVNFILFARNLVCAVNFIDSEQSLRVIKLNLWQLQQLNTRMTCHNPSV